MKNVFAVSTLFLLVGYPLTAAAQSLGLVQFAAADFPAFITSFIVVGLSAIFVADYAPRTPPPTTRRSARRARRPVAAESPEHAAWTLHTLSA